MIKKGKLAVGLVTVGVAAGALFPASAGANPNVVCNPNAIFCVPGGPGAAGLTDALTALATNPTFQDSGGETVVAARLAANHNETVLTLA